MKVGLKLKAELKTDVGGTATQVRKVLKNYPNS